LNLLLDTHLLLWSAQFEVGQGKLSATAITLIDDESNHLFFSPASIWEVAIKSALGRREFQADPHLLRRGLLDNGYAEIAITSEHAAAVAGLPPIHKDPFDRLLIAQSIAEGMILLTSDGTVAEYGGPIRRV